MTNKQRTTEEITRFCEVFGNPSEDRNDFDKGYSKAMADTLLFIRHADVIIVDLHEKEEKA